MQAMVATQPKIVNENCWFLDFAATNHVTNDLGSLAISSEYAGSGKIRIRNGTGLSISHAGHTSFNSNCRLLHLKNLVHVPLITKASISLSILCW